MLNFTPMRRSCSPLCLLLAAWALAGVPASAAADGLLKYHPAEGELPGLKVVEGSHQSGAGEGLTAIYDGGYQRYLRAGVKRASQRYYTLDGRTVELCVHEMKGEAAARKLLESMCQDAGAPSTAVTLGGKKGRICAVAAEGSAFGYLALKGFFLSSSVNQAEPKAADALLRASGERVANGGKTRRPAAKK